MNSLRQRITTLMLFRVVLITLVLGITVALNVAEPQQLAAPAQVVLFATIATTYALTLVYAYLLPRVADPSRFADYQLVGDLLITTFLVHVTGDMQSGYTFFYPLSIVGAATVRYRRGAIAAAVASGVLLVVVSLGGWHHLLPTPAGVAPWEASPLTVVRALTLNLGACTAIGVLAAILGAQLEQSGERLALSSVRAADLAALNQHVVRCLTSGLVTVDRDGRIMTLNDAAAEILGIAADDAIGRAALEVLPGLAPVLEGLGERGSARRAEIRARHNGGADLALGVSISPLYDGRGAAIGRIVNFQDLTELRRMESQVKRGERLAVIGGVVAGVAHEIRNPLASISGSIELLRAAPLSQDDHQLMDIVLREVDRLNGLLTDLLEYARPRERQVMRIGLAGVVDETVRVFAAGLSGCAVRVELGEGAADAELDGDPAQLRQVLWNLVRNAAEAMPGGGTIVVSLARDGGAVELAVSDEGQGITPEDQEHVFEPFFTTKKGGTGLGLAMVQRVVLEHGGQVGLSSQAGKGTRVAVRLPVAAASAAAM